MLSNLLIFANSAGLSLPLTVLALAGLHHFRMGPALVEVLASRYSWAFSTPVLVVAVVLALFEILASKSKISKPVRHLYDAFQTLCKPLAAGSIALAIPQSNSPEPILTAVAPILSGPTLAGMIPHVGTYVILAAVVSLLVHSVRAMADLLAWLSPVPLIDALVSGAADFYVAIMICLIAFLPSVALVLCVVQLVVCVALFRPLQRAAYVAFRILMGWLKPLRSKPPVLPRWVARRAIPSVPTMVWIEKASKLRRYEIAYVFLDGRTLHVATRRFLRQIELEFELPDSGWAALSDTMVAFSLVVHARQGLSPILAFGLARDQEQDARALFGELRQAGLPVDDATGTGDRLPAAWRARVSS